MSEASLVLGFDRVMRIARERFEWRLEILELLQLLII